MAETDEAALPAEAPPPEGDAAHPGADAPEAAPEAAEPIGELAFPEGFEVDGERLEAFRDWAGRNRLTQGQAQELVDLYLEAQQAEDGRRRQAQVDQLQDWERQARQDREIGGPEFERRLAVARGALERFGDSELRDLLDATGLGSHPALVRWMLKVGRATGEDRFIPPGGGAGPLSPEARARRLYDNSYRD